MKGFAREGDRFRSVIVVLQLHKKSGFISCCLHKTVGTIAAESCNPASQGLGYWDGAGITALVNMVGLEMATAALWPLKQSGSSFEHVKLWQCTN